MGSPKPSGEVTRETDRIKATYDVEEPPSLLDKVKTAIHSLRPDTPEPAGQSIETPALKASYTTEDDTPSLFQKFLVKVGITEETPKKHPGEE